MTTLALLKAEIKDDLDDTDDDYADYIAKAIRECIRRLQTRKLLFNVNREYTTATISGTDEYQLRVTASDQSDQAYPRFMEVSKVYVEFSATDIREMGFIRPREFDTRVVVSGEPFKYTYLYDTVKLHFKPNSADWTIHVHGHERIMWPVTDNEADNPWMLHAYNLIRAHVLADVFLYKKMQVDKARVFKEVEMAELNGLLVESDNAQVSTGIKPTDF